MEKPEFTHDQNKRYINLQLDLAKLMLELGSVKSPAEYVDRCAGLFEMLVMGQLKMATDEEVADMQNKVRGQLKLK